MKGLKIYHYDEVDDIIEEALGEICNIDITNRIADYKELLDDIVFEKDIRKVLKEKCGIETIIKGINNLQKGIEYVCGTINIVKLGDKYNTLKHKDYSNGIWSNDVDQTGTNYMDAVYYNKNELQNLVEKHLTRKYYNNDFLNL